MRSGPEKQKQGRSDRAGGRRRSYSSGSSRRRYSSSYSSRSSSRSRSRSSTPAGIPRRSGQGTGDRPVKKEPGSGVKNTAPLQKRLAAVTQPKAARVQRLTSKG